MKLVEWVKWRVAPREMEELERWRIQWEEHRRWFAEFPIAAVTLDHLKAKVEREPVTSIHVVRDSCRSADVKQVRQNHTAPPQQQVEPVAWDVFELRLYGAPQEKQHRVLWVDRYIYPDGSTPDLDGLLDAAKEEGGIDGGAKTLHVRPLYTTPPQRQWVGLTDEEIQGLRKNFATLPAIRAIEAKLRERNA